MFICICFMVFKKCVPSLPRFVMEISWWKGRYSYRHFSNEETVTWRVWLAYNPSLDGRAEKSLYIVVLRLKI